MNNSNNIQYGRMSHRENDQQLADFFSMEETDIQDWIQIGFFHDEGVLDTNIQPLLSKTKNPLIQSCTTLNDLLHLRDEQGERIGLEYWKQHGHHFVMVFDLANNSDSLQILKEYIAKKQYEKPEKYKDLKIL